MCPKVVEVIQEGMPGFEGLKVVTKINVIPDEEKFQLDRDVKDANRINLPLTGDWRKLLRARRAADIAEDIEERNRR